MNLFISEKYSNCKIEKYSMLFLALYPILDIYKFLPGISIGSILFFILMALDFFRRNGNLHLSYPKYYKEYWMYLAISYLILSNYKLASFIPGGLTFFVYSIIIGFIIPRFNYNKFKLYYRRIFIICFVVLSIQEIQYSILGYRFSALIPFFDLTDGIQTSSLIISQMTEDRSCSLFREPAQLAQYILPLLCMEFFDKDGIAKMSNRYAIFIIIMLLLLRSGNGILGLLLIVVIKFFYYFTHKSGISKWLKIAFICGFLIIPVDYYYRSEGGQYLFSRSNELENDEEGASFIRLYRGYFLYDALPTENKFFGISEDELLNYIPKSPVSYLFTGDRRNDLYYNCIQSILIFQGLVGFIFISLIYLRLFICTTTLGRNLILLLLLISLMASIYNTSFMLYCTCLSTILKKNKK